MTARQHMINIAIGTAKGIALLLPVILMYATMTGSNCRGSCEGLAWAVIFLLPIIAGVGLIFVIVYLTAMYFWTRDRKGAGLGVFLAPLVIYLSTFYVIGPVATEVKIAASRSARQTEEAKPTYRHTTAYPLTGKIKLLAMQNCTELCVEILLQGYADRIGVLAPEPEQDGQLVRFENIYQLANGQTCMGNQTGGALQQTMLKRGHFDRCIVAEASPEPVQDALLLRFRSDPPRADLDARFGALESRFEPELMNIIAAQPLRDGPARPEIARQEYQPPASKNGKPPKVDVEKPLEFLQAISGIKGKKDRSNSMGMDQRAELLLSRVNELTFDIDQAIRFMLAARDEQNFDSRSPTPGWDILQAGVGDLQQVARKICGREPNDHKRKYCHAYYNISAKVLVDCKLHYRALVEDIPTEAEKRAGKELKWTPYVPEACSAYQIEPDGV